MLQMVVHVCSGAQVVAKNSGIGFINSKAAIRVKGRLPRRSREEPPTYVVIYEDVDECQ